MLNFIKNSRYRFKLSIAFLLLSIMPLTFIGGFFLSAFNEHIEKQVFDKLTSIRDSKKNEVELYLSNLHKQADIFAKSAHVRYSISRYFGFSYAFDLVDPDPNIAAQKLRKSYINFKDYNHLNSSLTNDSDVYASVYERFHQGFTDYLNSHDFSNISLITPDGQIVYMSENSAYLGRNVNDNELSKSGVKTTFDRFNQLREDGLPISQLSVFTDFKWDQNQDLYQSHMAFPIVQHGRYTGMIVFTLPSGIFNFITQRRGGLGQSGEAYLVGQDRLPKSSLFAHNSLPQNYSVHNFVKNNIRFKSFAVEDGLKDKSGHLHSTNYASIETLTAYAPIHFLDQTWSLIVEMNQDEALAQSKAFKNLLIGLAIILIIMIIIGVVYLTAIMTKPIDHLMRATKAVSKGDVDRAILGIERKDEIGSLARSFSSMQKSIKMQMGQISHANLELEDKVKTIAMQNQELQIADQLKDEFLANTSHELRTPLNGIIGLVESLIDGAAGMIEQKPKKHLGMIKDQANRLSSLVDDLLDFHRIKHNQVTLNLQSVDAYKIVEHIIFISSHLLGDKELSIRCKMDRSLPHIWVDPIRFEQILYNLIGNAIKYTEKGEIVLSAFDKDGRVYFELKDSGIGMAPQARKHVFEPFVQMDGGITRKVGGTGLGLSIAKKLTELMEGTLNFKSRIGYGTCFYFDFGISETQADKALEMIDDISDIDEKAARLIKHNPNHYNADRKDIELIEERHIIPFKETILVVDDEDINLQIIKNHLSLEGYDVLLANGAEQAFMIMEHKSPSLIILDVMMPRVSGYQMAQKLRQKFDMHQLPILMLTARAEVKDLMAGFDAGANDYLVKPFLKNELIARVKSLIEVKNSVDRLQENIQLKEEVAKRLETENQLKMAKERMLHLLNNIDDAIISFNIFGEIVFFNQKACDITALETNHIIGKDISKLIKFEDQKTIRRLAEQKGRAKFDLQLLQQKDEHHVYSAHISNIDSLNSQDIALILRPSSEQNSQAHIPIIENALAEAQNFMEQEGQNFHQNMMLTNHKFSQAKTLNKDEILQDLLVDIMNDSLLLWQEYSGLDKIAFAEESRIWRVYMDRSSLQTRTLDKYLLKQTIPKKPRWRDVLRSGNFVINYIRGLDHAEKGLTFPDQHDQFRRLSRNIERLETHFL